jgi:glutamate/tyrosine decarboxylase-like PLP-dependent enzyme
MMNKTDLRSRMYDEMRSGRIFEQVQNYALQYLNEVFEREVFPTEEALADLEKFREDLPNQTGRASEVLDFLHQYGSPATLAQLGGRYFGFVNGSAVPAGLAAKHLATYWDQNSGMQISSPIASSLETIVETWLKQIFELPERTVAGFVSGTSSANLCGLAAARYRLLKKTKLGRERTGALGGASDPCCNRPPCSLFFTKGHQPHGIWKK